MLRSYEEQEINEVWYAGGTQASQFYIYCGNKTFKVMTEWLLSLNLLIQVFSQTPELNISFSLC